MSNPLRVYQTYSVFVGHIHPDTKKYELRDLFKGCGEVVDTVIIEGRDTFNFGFVRFTDKDSVRCAVSELNNWSLHGRNIIVAIEKHTQLKLEQEESGLPVTVVDGMGSRRRNLPKPAVGKTVGTDYITDTMYRTRLQESCTALNLKQNNTSSKHLSVNHLTDDIGKVPGGRTTLWGSVDDVTSGFDEMSRKIMQRCQQKAVDGGALGKKNSAEFMCAIRSIMKEISEFLEIKSDNDVKYMNDEELEEIEQLKLEGNLVREINEELETDIEDDRNQVVNVESGNLNRSNTMSAPKRLSDVSVQTVEDTDYEVAASRKSLEGSISSSNQGATIGHVTDNVTKEHAEGWNYVTSSDDSETDLSYVDPAIIDYHLSKLKEIEEAKHKHGEIEESLQSKDAKRDDFFRLFNSKMNPVGAGAIGAISRSSSRDSSLSEGSNEGTRDDSGVESDCFGISKGRRSFGVVENMLGANNVGREETKMRHMNDMAGRPRTLKGATSDPNLGMTEASQCVVRGVGRGRGVFSAVLGNKEPVVQSNHSIPQGHHRLSAEERKMLDALSKRKLPVGRGHFGD